MKYYLNCAQCFREQGIPSFEFAEAEIDNDFHFYMTCSKGHKTLTLLNAERFEILFDFGCEAFLDGYYRESVSSIAAAVERYHEFFIKVLMLHNGISEANIDEIWKLVATQSERQLGAFYFLYLRELKVLPDSFIKKNTAFRNKVIHNGVFPTKEETIKYNEEAFKHIVEGLKILKRDYLESVELLTRINLRKAIPQDNKCLVSTMSNLSTIGMAFDEKNNITKSFAEVLVEFRERIENMQNIPKVSKYAGYLKKLLMLKIN